MSQSAKAAVFVVCLFAVALFALTVLAVQLESDFATFLPDLIVGVIGAGAITALIALIQYRSDVRRSEAADVQSAYYRVLDTLGTMRTFRPDAPGAPEMIGELATRLIMLGELQDQKFPSVLMWFEAERQLSLHKAEVTMRQVNALPRDADIDAHVDALSPFLIWVTEFTNNLRAWRTGVMTDADMQKQARSIESLLRNKTAWRDKAMPWRPDSQDVTAS